LSDRGGGNLLEAVGHDSMQLAGGLDGGRPKGPRRKAMDKSERVLGVARSLGIPLAGRRRAKGSYPWWLSDG
jgi:hypothetical protein